MTREPTVADYMSPKPHAVNADETLSAAHRLMRSRRIRHLPVLNRGRLVGVVSQRDLHLVETLRDVNPDEVRVGEAMSEAPYVVSPTTPLRRVAAEMWKKKVGSAVVCQGKKLVGLFTTHDAVGALVTLLARR